MLQEKADYLAQLKKKLRTLQIKKNFLLLECQNKKDKLDELKGKA